MRYLRIILTVLAFLAGTAAFAQVDRREVRRGNREFRRGDFAQADISYRKALLKDSLSFAANYNLANTQYRQGNYPEATAQLQKIAAQAPLSPHAADYFFNLGDAALAQQDWPGAIEAFKQVLLRQPGDMEAKENLAYAQLMQQNDPNGGGGGQDQNQNQNQNQNQDQNQDQNQNDQNQDNQDQDQNDQNQDQKQDNNQNQDQQNQQQPQQQPKISPQQAQQMLQAIQAKEKETQDKVKKAEAEAAQSRQKEKNW